MKKIGGLVLACNSALWIGCVGFCTYAVCMLFIEFDWRQCVFAFALFIAVTIVEVILATLLN